MPRNGSGTYNLPAADLPVSNTLALASKMNNVFNDIATAITTSVATDGQSTMTGNLKMGGFQITGLAAGSVSSAAISVTGEINTGIYFPATGEVGVAVSGARRFRVLNSGAVAYWSTDDGVTLSGTSTNNSTRVALGFDGTSVFGLFYDRATGAGGLWHGTGAAGSRTDRLSIDAAGNIAVGGSLTVTGAISGGTISGNTISGNTISGVGSGLTSLNASNISSGTLADARLSTNVALKNAANTFTADQVVNVGANSVITISASSTPQLRMESTAQAVDNRNWITLISGLSWELRVYNDSYLSSTTALSIGRSGATAGNVQTYGDLYVGTLQSGIGYIEMHKGSGGNTGYAAFYNSSGGREGYIGWSSTTGGSDTGTIPYVAGEHAFSGRMSVSKRAYVTPQSVAFSTTPTFDSSTTNTIYFETMTANVTSVTISNAVDGAQLQIRFVQDATGGRTVTLPSSVQVSGSLNTAANAVTWLVLTYVGSASRWEGTWTRVS